MSEKRTRPDERGVPESEALVDVSIFYDMKRSFDGATSAPAEWRQREACNLLVHALDIAASMCGSEVLELAYGRPKSADRKEQLLLLADRLQWPALLFAGIKAGERNGSFEALAEECESVARGDAPTLLAQLPGYRKNVRLLAAKFRAIRWDAYLGGLGLSAKSRQDAIAAAFVQQWDTIRGWKKDAIAAWGDEPIGACLRRDAHHGAEHLHLLGTMEPNYWRSALARSGRVFTRQAGYSSPPRGRK